MAEFLAAKFLISSALMESSEHRPIACFVILILLKMMTLMVTSSLHTSSSTSIPIQQMATAIVQPQQGVPRLQEAERQH
jgi:hypothetical protein